MSRRHTPGERGSAGLLTVFGALMVTTVGLALVVAATDLAVAGARARTAADAAALAAAGALPLAGGDGDVQGAARQLAAANDAQVVACCDPQSAHSPAPAVVVVEVVVHPRLRPLRRMVVPARAAAGLRPD